MAKPAFAGKNSVAMSHFVKTEQGQFMWQSYWEINTPFSGHIDFKEAIDAASAAIATQWAVLAPAEHIYVGTKAVQYSGGTELDVFSADGVPGAVSDSPGVLGLPDTVALLIQRRTANQERHKMGRFYVPGIAETVNDNGYVTNDMMEDCQLLATMFGSTQTWDGVEFNARHWDRKTPDLTVITHCRAMRRLAVRSNRRSRQQNLPVGAEA